MKKIYILASALLAATTLKAQQVVDFEELAFPESQNHWNGDDESGGFQSKNLTFSNEYNTEWDSWSGFAYSKATNTETAGAENQYSAYAPLDFWNGMDSSGGFKMGSAFFTNNYNFEWGSWTGFSYSRKTDTVTEGHTNMYSAITGSGNNDSPNYAVWNSDGEIVLDEETQVNSVNITNTTYAYLSMLNGDDFAKEFEQDDWFRLTIYGWTNADEKVEDSVVFYLADYRDADPAEHYIIDAWETVDISILGNVKKLSFNLESTDVGDWGMNTPNYFAMDDLHIGEPGSEELIDFENLPFQGSGNNKSSNYAVWNSNGEISFDSISEVHSIAVTNTTYAYYSMKEGDDFATQFNQGDWFKLTVFGWDENNEIKDSVSYYLADYRDTDQENHYIIEAWEEIDLTSLGEIRKLSFNLTSSDVGDWGMNTPNYFAMDDIIYETKRPLNTIENNKDLSVSVYPNPATTIIHINGENGTIALFDNSGRIVWEGQHNDFTTIDVQNLPNGLYFLHLKSKKGVATEKVILQ